MLYVAETAESSYLQAGAGGGKMWWGWGEDHDDVVERWRGGVGFLRS